MSFRCLGRGRDKRPDRRSGFTLDAGSLRPVQPQGSGSGAILRARAFFARPVQHDGNHRATRCLERCHLSSRGACLSIAGVAGLHPSPTPRNVAARRCVLRAVSRRSCAASYRACAHATWREAVAHTHRCCPRASLLAGTAIAGTASDVRAHTTVGAAFKGMPSRDEGSEPT